MSRAKIIKRWSLLRIYPKAKMRKQFWVEKVQTRSAKLQFPMIMTIKAKMSLSIVMESQMPSLSRLVLWQWRPSATKSYTKKPYRSTMQPQTSLVLSLNRQTTRFWTHTTIMQSRFYQRRKAQISKLPKQSTWTTKIRTLHESNSTILKAKVDQVSQYCLRSLSKVTRSKITSLNMP